MAQFVDLTAAQLADVQTAFDEMLNLEMEPCQLVYPPKNIACNNCVPDPIGNRSSNKYLTGGPMPFPMGGLCPICGGRGVKAVEVSETVNLCIVMNPRKFVNIGPQIQVTDGMIQTQGYANILPKVLKCDHLIKSAVQGYQDFSYKLEGDPFFLGNIIKNRYFYANWRRA
jgi:hypothetical protein